MHVFLLFSPCNFDNYLSFRNHVSKLRKNERNYLFYFKILFFYLHHSEKINLLKAIDAANLEKVNKIKPHKIQIKFQRNIGCNIYPPKLPIPPVSVFICFFFLCFCFCLRFYEKASGRL